jgi:hypothetical protein
MNRSKLRSGRGERAGDIAAQVSTLSRDPGDIVSRMSSVRAPALPTDVPWLNVVRPLTPEQLLGRVILLDFWTYC